MPQLQRSHPFLRHPPDVTGTSQWVGLRIDPFYTMRINIINYEQGRFDGILSKFAIKLNEELLKLGYDSYITATSQGESDIRHHINYLPYKHDPNYKGKDTLMVTHIFEGYKKDALTEQMKTAFGICMSDWTKNQLIKWGFDKKKKTLSTG